MTKKRTLWSDTFTIVFTLPKGKEVTETFEGSLRSAIRYALKRHDTAVANFYTSNNCWLKEICW